MAQKKWISFPQCLDATVTVTARSFQKLSKLYTCMGATPMEGRDNGKAQSR